VKPAAGEIWQHGRRVMERTMVSFEDHVAYAEPPIRPVLRAIRARITALETIGGKIEERPTKEQRIAYRRVDHEFAEVKVQKYRILVRFHGMGVPDPRNLVTNIPAKHKWPENKQIAVDSLDAVDYAMTFVDASYRGRR
jgi:predicted transport protein